MMLDQTQVSFIRFGKVTVGGERVGRGGVDWEMEIYVFMKERCRGE